MNNGNIIVNNKYKLLLLLLILVIFILAISFSCKFKKLKIKKRPEGNFTIIDNVEVCDSALEEIYDDDKYIYYLPCIKSNQVYIKFSNGEKVKIRTALKNNYVTIDEIIEKNYPICVEAKIK